MALEMNMARSTIHRILIIFQNYSLKAARWVLRLDMDMLLLLLFRWEGPWPAPRPSTAGPPYRDHYAFTLTHH